MIRLSLILTSLLLTLQFSTANAAESKPNILVIISDDVGVSNISAYHRGMMGGRTPNIDSSVSKTRYTSSTGFGNLTLPGRRN